MTQIQQVSCPHCQASNLAQDAVCLSCGRPIRDGMQTTIVIPAPRQGLNGRQRSFLQRYVLPLAIFLPLYALLIALLKMPSMSLGDWLVHPILPAYRSTIYGGQLVQRPSLPWWAVLAVIDTAITAAIVYFTRPISWKD